MKQTLITASWRARFAALMMVGLALAAPSWAIRGGQEGNGGGGVVRNGQYMTFYSAGLYVEPTNTGTPPPQIPKLMDLFNYISSLKYLKADQKSLLLNTIVPSNTRHYYIADPAQLTPEVKERLLAEFSRVTGVGTDSLELFALTDTTSRTTFILPDFMKLSPNDQMAILFHENYWILYPNTSYNDVVNEEMAFQASLEDPQSLQKMFNFLLGLNRQTDPSTGSLMIQIDLSTGALKGLLDSNGKIPLSKLIGQPTIDQAKGGNDRDLIPFFQANINILQLQYPNSLVIQYIAKNFDTPDAYGHRAIFWMHHGHNTYCDFMIFNCDTQPLNTELNYWIYSNRDDFDSISLSLNQKEGTLDYGTYDDSDYLVIQLWSGK